LTKSENFFIICYGTFWLLPSGNTGLIRIENGALLVRGIAN
jgi:hypothetical protein